MDYKDRYCAFIDVLGFSGLIGAIRTSSTDEGKAERFETVRSILRAVHEPMKDFAMQPDPEVDFHSQSISDAVAISTVVDQYALLDIFNSIEELAIKLLCQGYFIRGAIVKGPLYHDDKMVFGEALISAYELEQSVVRYPRVMVSREVAIDWQQYHEAFLGNKLFRMSGDFYKGRVLQSDDGPMYLHLLNRVVRALDRKEIREGWTDMRRQIVERFNASTDNPRHFEKVQWFARYWNEFIAPTNVEGFERIPGPGLDPKPSVC